MTLDKSSVAKISFWTWSDFQDASRDHSMNVAIIFLDLVAPISASVTNKNATEEVSRSFQDSLKIPRSLLEFSGRSFLQYS